MKGAIINKLYLLFTYIYEYWPRFRKGKKKYSDAVCVAIIDSVTWLLHYQILNLNVERTVCVYTVYWSKFLQFYQVKASKSDLEWAWHCLFTFDDSTAELVISSTVNWLAKFRVPANVREYYTSSHSLHCSGACAVNTPSCSFLRVVPWLWLPQCDCNGWCWFLLPTENNSSLVVWPLTSIHSPFGHGWKFCEKKKTSLCGLYTFIHIT